jgi:hypothetical protein
LDLQEKASANSLQSVNEKNSNMKIKLGTKHKIKKEKFKLTGMYVAENPDKQTP